MTYSYSIKHSLIVGSKWFNRLLCCSSQSNDCYSHINDEVLRASSASAISVSYILCFVLLGLGKLAW